MEPPLFGAWPYRGQASRVKRRTPRRSVPKHRPKKRRRKKPGQRKKEVTPEGGLYKDTERAFLEEAKRRPYGPPPVFFFEPRGSYSATWRCRWQRIRCAFGFHVWGMGPASMERNKPADLILNADRFMPEACMFGSPFCRARRLTPLDRYPDWRTRWANRASDRSIARYKNKKTPRRSEGSEQQVSGSTPKPRV